MINAQGYDLGTSEAVLIVPALHTAQDVRLHNHDRQNNRFVYVGGSDVSSSNGFDVGPSAYVSITVPAGDELWAISNHNTVEFHVMRIAK